MKNSISIGLKCLLVVALCLTTWQRKALAQTAPPVILQVDLQNVVQYYDDVTDWSKLATIPNPTTPAFKNFTFGALFSLADIVAVNGKPVKGTLVIRGQNVSMSPAANPGQAIADIARGGHGEETYEFMQLDGTSIGTIMTAGLIGGTAPSGSLSLITSNNFAIVGGTGAYLGAKGQGGGGVLSTTTPIRLASATEDPSTRRVNGGGRQRRVLYVIPLSRPAIAVTSNGPAVVHSSDFTPVTASNPAHAGEILSLFATGLGPTRPSVDPGQPFPASPLAVVNSPVDIMVNGTSADVIGAAGFPGSVDGYQVNFRVPAGTAAGSVSVQVSAAWITSPAVTITVQ